MTPNTPKIKSVSDRLAPPSPGQLVTELGPHPATLLGLRFAETDSDLESQLEHWLLGSCLLGGRTSREQGLASLRALEAAGISSLPEVRSTETASLARVLEASGYPRAEAAAVVVYRLAVQVGKRGNGALGTIGRSAASLEELGGQLSGLATGFGAARIRRFLQPLRELWPAASELPLEPNACAAAVHLGWIGDADDSPSSLCQALDAESDAIGLADLESALAELGRRACRAEKTLRCPLAQACPRRSVPGESRT